jgi:hypothetical protein
MTALVPVTVAPPSTAFVPISLAPPIETLGGFVLDRLERVPTPTPESTTLLLWATSAAGIGLVRWCRQ